MTKGTRDFQPRAPPQQCSLKKIVAVTKTIVITHRSKARLQMLFNET